MDTESKYFYGDEGRVECHKGKNLGYFEHFWAVFGTFGQLLDKHSKYFYGDEVCVECQKGKTFGYFDHFWAVLGTFGNSAKI